jgi:hypothetical protein
MFGRDLRRQTGRSLTTRLTRLFLETVVVCFVDCPCSPGFGSTVPVGGPLVELRMEPRFLHVGLVEFRRCFNKPLKLHGTGSMRVRAEQRIRLDS